MNDESSRTMATDYPQAGPAYAAKSDAPQDCECEFCSPEPEPIPAPWERNGDPEHDLRPLSMSESNETTDDTSDETPTLTLIPLSPR